MKLERVSQNEWEEASKQCSVSSVYLDPRWLKLIGEVYPGLNIERLVCLDGSGAVRWLLPLVEIKPLGRKNAMLISLPFGNSGGFLLPPDVEKIIPEDAAPLEDFFKDSAAFALELRETERPSHGFEVSDTFQRFEIALPDTVGELWDGIITGNARTCVRKAEKAGVEAVCDHTEAVSVFQGLHEKHASGLGTPIHHPDWYYKLAELFQPETEIVLGQIGSRFVGALLVMHGRDRSILHAAVSDPDFRAAPVTDMLLWSFLERAVQNKSCRVFDFGRTRPDPGKLFFKKKWGARQLPVFYSYLLKPGAEIPRILPDNPKYGLAIKAWRYLPMGVKRKIGPLLRVRIPT